MPGRRLYRPVSQIAEIKPLFRGGAEVYARTRTFPPSLRPVGRNAPATRDLRHALVIGTRGSVDGRRALRRATIRLRRAKGPPHGLVITWRAHRAPFRGALARAARGRAPRTVHALHPPSHGRQPRGHFSSASARASFAARQRGTYSSAAIWKLRWPGEETKNGEPGGEALASAARRPRHRHDARLPFMMDALLGADGGWSGDPRHSASRIGSAGRRTSPAPAPAR